jgi:plastocyanin
VATGGTVTFAFGSVGHSVQFDSGPTPPANIPGTNADTSVARTFSTAGTYKFHCTIHPTMLGTVTVLAAASSTDY